MPMIRVRTPGGAIPTPPDRLFVQLCPEGPNPSGGAWDGTPQTDRFTDDAGQTDFAGAWTVWPADSMAPWRYWRVE